MNKYLFRVSELKRFDIITYNTSLILYVSEIKNTERQIIAVLKFWSYHFNKVDSFMLSGNKEENWQNISPLRYQKIEYTNITNETKKDLLKLAKEDIHFENYLKLIDLIESI